MSVYNNRTSASRSETDATADEVNNLSYEDTLEQATVSDEELRHDAVLAAQGTYAADTDDTSDEVAAARAQIEETRSHLSETVDAIKEKLSPHNLMEEAKESVKEAASNKIEQVKEAAMDIVHNVTDSVTGFAHNLTDGAKNLAHNMSDSAHNVAHSTSDSARPIVNKAHTQGGRVVDAIRMNPLPAAIAGFGLGWLLLSIRKQEDTRYYSDNRFNDYNGGNSFDRGRGVDTLSNSGMATTTGFGYQPMDVQTGTTSGTDNGTSITERAKDGLYHAGEAVSNVAGAAKDKVSDVAGAAKDKVSDVAGAAKEKVSQFATATLDTAGDLAHSAKDKASDIAYAAKDKAQATYSSLDNFVHENPLAAGAVALLIGAAVGMSLPSTHKENEWMGDTRDRLKDKASDIAGEYVEKAQHVAQAALGTAKESFQDVKEQVMDSFQEAKDQVKDSVIEAKDQVKDSVKSEAKAQGLKKSTSNV